MKILGSNLILGTETGGTFSPVAYSRSCEINEDRDTIETASPHSGQWREHRAGRCGWTMTCECLLSDNESALETAFRIGAPIPVTCRARDGSFRYSGNAIITSLRISGRLHEMATYSISLQGTGELTYISLG